MCIYCGTNRYIKIYKNHHGVIPKDPTGRSYEVHHIDGNHSNNLPENLTCVSIQQHYDIHYSQADWGACFLMAQKMSYSPEEISELNRKQNQSRIRAGTHNLLKREDGSSLTSDRVKEGTHHWLSKNRKGIPGRGKSKRELPTFNWKNTITSETALLSVRDFVKKYRLEQHQGNVYLVSKNKAISVKGWIIGI